MNVSLRNIKEEVVEKALADVLQNYDCCKCEKCRLDMMAIVLNHLRPHYIVTRKGEAMTINKYLTSDSQAEIIAEVVLAIERVKTNPQHLTDEND
ncbi:late competence development ComFB family protein [Oscillospiraceae bacterium OttesenSCG-928-G22]|nr:late competence development ComFB family protein [Oscillospiraceae bacterium OttesenSCG-928-G22]